jgi:rRNA maturation RNase YbeY
MINIQIETDPSLDGLNNREYFNELYEKEIARLIIHGGLHLIGYDDNTENKRKEMQKLEDKYLKELGF